MAERQTEFVPTAMPEGRKVAMQTGNGDRMKRVVVDHLGGPDYGADDARRAHELLGSSADKGKLVLVP